jgi:tRNA threonylcarbamoyladenosine biosynthesis protein TsaE
MVETRSAEETEDLGARLAALLPTGTVVALRGDLATGKTCLVRGMASYFAKGTAIHSPTFTLVNEYGDAHKLYHLDLYRLGGAEEVADLGYEELFEPDGVCVVEWAERAERLLPPRRLDVTLEHAGEDRRQLHFIDHGVLPSDWIQRVKETS